jgi:broad specificity phosphatase PhoE
MKLLLLRHGQTHSNVIGALDTAVPGAPLTELGERQAAAVPHAFASTAIGAIYVSTLTRTQQTAAPLAEALGMTPTILDGLREIAAGSLEMLDDPKSQGEYNATAFAWARGDRELRMPGGEDGVEFFTRFDAAIAGIRAGGGGTVVAVSHGAAIRTWVAARCANTDGEFAGTHTLDNTGLARLESRDHDQWELLDWQAAPVGGIQLADSRAVDPTGEGTA